MTRELPRFTVFVVVGWRDIRTPDSTEWIDSVWPVKSTADERCRILLDGREPDIWLGYAVEEHELSPRDKYPWPRS